ncbi:MAG: DNA primase, partial [Candidatus Chisholmbacteria bacterium]|nr:DNA primase [Candidatus Chisholmbacteria bacterium]
SDQVQEVKQKADIVAIIGERVKLSRAGRNFKALCPFHSEKTPSFNVSPELGIYKCFGCFPADELVKTPFGLHHIQDVVEGEYVISGAGEIQRVLATHKRDYRGEMVTLRLRKLSEPVRLTSDHQVYVVGGSPLYSQNYKYLSKRLHEYSKYPREKRLPKIWKYFPIEKLQAGSLEKGMTLLYPIESGVRDLLKIDLTDYITKEWPAHGARPLVPDLEIKVNGDFLRLLGYYIAEGSSHRAYVRFSLGSHEGDFAREIVSLLDKIFCLPASIHQRSKKSKSGIEVSCCNSILANVFENLCGKGAENKHIPFLLQQLPLNKQRILLNAIYKGDGYKRRFSRSDRLYRVVVTTSRILAEQLRDLLLRLSYFPSVNVESEKIDRKSVHHKQSYTVLWCEEPEAAKFRHIYEDRERNKYWLLPVWKVKSEDFRGEVYNLTVDEDHSYVANTFAVANCGEAGDVFSFLEKFEGMTFPEALEYVANRVGVRLERVRLTKEDSARRRALAILSLAAEFYHYLLLEHKVGEEALLYLRQRGMWLETIKQFQLGYAPDNWEGLIKYLVGKKKYDMGDLEAVGLVVKTSSASSTPKSFATGQAGRASRTRYYDRFRGRVMFPLTNQRGQVVGFAGRVLAAEAKEAKYVNTPETAYYHKSELLYGLSVTKRGIATADQVVVVEGELDALSSWQAKVKNVVAIKGSAVTEGQLALISRYTRNVVLALDADRAGEEAVKRGIATADRMGVNVRVAILKGGKDPDEIAQRNAAGWQTLVGKAVSVYDFYLASALGRFDAKSGEGKRLISREFSPILARISNQVEQAHYMGKVAKVLGVAEEVVAREVARVGVELGQKEVVEKGEKEREERQVMDEYVLGLLFRKGRRMFAAARELDEKWFLAPAVRRVVEFLSNSASERFWQKGKFDIGGFVESLPAELREVVERVWLLGEGEDKETTEREWGRTVAELERRFWRRRLNELSGRIETLEQRKKLTAAEDKKLSRLQERFVEASRALTKLG